MRNVLIVTYYFSQSEGVAPVRLRGLVKYLPEHGWDVTVLTIKCNTVDHIIEKGGQRIIETDYRDPLQIWKQMLGLNPKKGLKEQCGLPTCKQRDTLVDICLRIWESIFTYPEPEIGWYKPAIDAGTSILHSEFFDAILSSSGPSTSHLIASYLSNRFGIPWVADLRDLWTQNHYYPHSSFRRLFETRLEKKTLGLANALTTVSYPLNEKLCERYSEKHVFTIPNGFDPEETNPGVPLSKGFTITYTGQLYRGRRDPEPLFKALSELIRDGVIERGDVSVDFYGRYESWLEEDATKYKLGDVVTLHGLVPREIAVRKQWESQALLLLTWNDPSEKGVYTGKVFEYLAARRPILSLGLSGGVITELLNDTNAGIHISTEEGIKSYLIAAYKEFKTNGFVRYTGVQSEIDKYSHYEMARKFAEVLNAVT